jgi:hypothetical protein
MLFVTVSNHVVSGRGWQQLNPVYSQTRQTP